MLKNCANCGRESATLRRCGRCHERKVATPVYYCSQACQKNDWKEHKKWHKMLEEEQERLTATRMSTHKEQEQIEATLCTDLSLSEDEYDVLLLAAYSHGQQGNHRHAIKLLRRAIDLEPEKHAAYGLAGCMCANSADHVGAAQFFRQAMECSSDDGERCNAAGSLIDQLRHPACMGVPKPVWWTDEGLLELTARMVAPLPGITAAVKTERYKFLMLRSEVLAGGAGSLLPAETVTRTPEMLREAARCAEEAAELCDDPDGKQSHRQLANALALRGFAAQATEV